MLCHFAYIPFRAVRWEGGEIIKIFPLYFQISNQSSVFIQSLFLLW